VVLVIKAGETTRDSGMHACRQLSSARPGWSASS